MKTVCKFKKPLLLSAGAIALWAIQFLLFPAIFPRFFPQSNESAFLLLVPLLLAAVSCTWIFRVRLIQWLPANCVYALFTALLNGNGHYGIGLRGIRLDGAAPTYSPALAGLMALAILAVLLLTQSTTCSLRRLYRKLKKTS